MKKPFSIVIPIFNEEENIFSLIKRIKKLLNISSKKCEVIAVNDGSTDKTLDLLKKEISKNKFLRIIDLKTNHGQTAAIMAGLNYCTNDIIIIMDSDLQNDPDDIPNLIRKIDEGYDVVSGWRKNRKDPYFSRVLPSNIANIFISWVSGVKLHDHGCSLKAYKKEVLSEVKLYGEMHRFISIYAKQSGANVTEIEVKHHPRKHGLSKYGMNRIYKVILDILVLKFLDKYLTKPIYLFGGFGLISFAFSIMVFLYMIYLKFFENISMIMTPLPLVVIVAIISGILSFLIGLLAEMLVRVYFESQNKPIYSIKALYNIKDKN